MNTFKMAWLAFSLLALAGCSIEVKVVPASTESPSNTQAAPTVGGRGPQVAPTVAGPGMEAPSVLVLQVLANRGWQDAGIAVRAGQQITIEYMSGLWFEDPPGRWHDASGGPNPWICTAPDCHEPLHDFPKYALIGRIGGSMLRVGNRLDFVTDIPGMVQLRPNYGDEDIARLNPQGAVTVKVTVR